MKIYIPILIIFFTACRTSQSTIDLKKVLKDSSIVYILPYNVDTLLTQEIKKQGDEVYFCLYTYTNYFEIYIAKTSSKNTSPYVKYTNRKIFLDGKFYPLICNEDMVFGTTDNLNEVLNEYFKEKYITKKNSYTIHEGYYIKFKIKGEIIESGYALEQPLTKPN